MPAGFGRMGRFFAGDAFGIKPDIVMFAKGLGGGYFPMAAIGMTDEIYDGITKKDTAYPHVFTYGGHPVSCAVALKTIEIIDRDALMEKANTTGDYIRERMTRIQNTSPWVGDVRGIGLYYGIELVKNKETGEPFPPEKKVSMKVRERLFGPG